MPQSEPARSSLTAPEQIDMHAHFYGGGLDEALRRRHERPYLRRGQDGVDYLVAMNAEFPFTPKYFDPSVGLAQMASQGLTRRMLTFPGALGVDVLPVDEAGAAIAAFNDHLAVLGRDTKGALIGLAGLPFADIALAAAELTRVRRDLKLPGAIVPSNYFSSIANARQLTPLLEAANAAGSHLMLHPGLRAGETPPQQRDDNPQYRTSAVELQSQASQNVLTLVLSDILEAYPNISFQVVNLGGTIPFIFERMENIARHRSPDRPFPTGRLRDIWYDCASLGPLALEAAVKVYGADRIMMGSDYPIFQDSPYERVVAPARLSDADKEMIAGDTALRLLERLDGFVR